MADTAAKLRVRGTCPKCRRVVNHYAPKGRSTWRGPCPSQGCEGTVFARRIPDAEAAKAAAEGKETVAGDTTADAAGDPPNDDASAQKTRKKIVKVPSYERTSVQNQRTADVQQPPAPRRADPGVDDGKPRPDQRAAGDDDTGPGPDTGPARKVRHPEVAPSHAYGHIGYPY